MITPVCDKDRSVCGSKSTCSCHIICQFILLPFIFIFYLIFSSFHSIHYFSFHFYFHSALILNNTYPVYKTSFLFLENRLIDDGLKKRVLTFWLNAKTGRKSVPSGRKVIEKLENGSESILEKRIKNWHFSQHFLEFKLQFSCRKKQKKKEEHCSEHSTWVVKWSFKYVPFSVLFG